MNIEVNIRLKNEIEKFTIFKGALTKATNCYI